MDALPDISPFQRRLDELDAQMAEPSFYANQRRAAEVTREQQKLRKLVDDHRAYVQVERELRDAAALAARGVRRRPSCASSRAPRSPGSSAGRPSCARPCSWR